ncbi:Oxysterol-binding protein-like protein [Smittium mucronatum]|uniref:Oxysterol-binding protein-like protein n=1 Tax=Smittium mucronatum TaxID=133383 RepID=A0A1R0H283_9FUNG|nr:Oxysterol-binding protein-like protein [Smittium mucronatum]
MEKEVALSPNRDNEEELDEEPRNIILSIVSQLSTNMDLSRVTLPTFVLETRSFTERITDFFTHPAFLLNANQSTDPLERFVNGVRYYMSGWHIHPKGVKKPYNPVLGEFFRSEHILDEGARKAFYVSEQVSHHPPVSAFYYTFPDDEIHIEGELRPKGKFYGNSVGVILNGETRVYLKNHDEEYILTYPNMYARGILFGKMFLEIGEKSSLQCKKSDLVFKVEFKTKGFFGRECNQVFGKIKKISTGKTLYEIYGDWQTTMYIKSFVNGDSSTKIFFDSSQESTTPLVVAPIEDQEENESRRLWNETTISIKKRDLDRATEEKTKIENKQRQDAKDRQEKGITWTPRFFNMDPDTGNFHPKVDYKSMSCPPTERVSIVRDFIFDKPPSSL